MRSVLQSDPNGNVINLSDYSFTKVHYKYINKNLNFYPIPGYYKKKGEKKQCKKLYQKDTRRNFYENNENHQAEETVVELIIKCKSNWEPISMKHRWGSRKKYRKDFAREEKLPRNNLSKTDKAAINHFTKREGIVITEADKRGASVIIGVEEYVSIAT